MIIFFTIFQYLVQACVDLIDKFLITARKIEPVNYTFYTVVTGLLLVLAWPWVFACLAPRFIFLDLFSGAVFSLAMYVFFVCVSRGEISRVIPFVFGLVPVFDILIAYFTGRNPLTITEFSAMFLLIPGALLVSHQKGKFWAGHMGLKTLSAFLFSCYYALWQYGSQSGPVLNSLIWNRIGAAAVLLILLFWPSYRKKVFTVEKVKHKRSTSFIFLFKQILGGVNFIFLSFLYSLGTISIINALQGFRYVFLMVLSLFLSKKRRHIIEEETSREVIWQKSLGVGLIFLGVLLLFV